MFARPRHIWATYLLILACLATGLAWLTMRVLELDERERLTQAQAEQEEKIRLALWRMESLAMPIIAAEAARPFSTYAPFVQPVADDPNSRIPSPLLQPPSEYVLLNFQVDSRGQVFSPQCPPAQDRIWACSNGSTLSSISLCCDRLTELHQALPAETLLSYLPAQPVPQQATSTPSAVVASNNAFVQNSNTIVPEETITPEEPSTKEYLNRASKLQMLTQQSAVQQRQVFDPVPSPTSVVEGISRPLWIDDQLLLARRVDIGHQWLIQGCWLNWDRLHQELAAELIDLLPAATIQTVAVDAQSSPTRTLASLPVQLAIPPITLNRQSWTPIHVALIVAWSALGLASVALATLLYGVASLSERRAAFVSAVTHELRTPLTTLQLYTELLNSNMVPAEQQQQEYLQTLHREAGRLSHLVENVLALSRLERQPARRNAKPLKLSTLIDRAIPRLQARAEQSDRPLKLELDPSVNSAVVSIEPTIVEQILLNLIDNSCKYASPATDATLTLSATVHQHKVFIRLHDHGPGLGEAARNKLFQKFSKTDMEAARGAPGLGLGLALSRELARSEAGDLQLESTTPQGTTFLLTLPISR